MKNESLIAKFYPHILGLFSAIFVVIPLYTTMAILGWVAFLLIGGILKSIQFKWNWKMSLWIGLYLLYVIGSFFTDHSDIAGKYLEYKLSFVILPVLFSFQPKVKYSISITFLWFIISIICLSLLGFYNSFLCGFSINCFSASIFSYVHHPTYFSAFHVLAMSAAIVGYIKKWRYFNLNWIIPFILFSLVCQILSLSLAGILFLGVLFMTFLLRLVYKTWKIKGLLIGIVAFPVLFFVFVNSVPQIESQWTVAKFYANEYKTSPKDFVENRQYPFSGTEVRLVMWTAAYQTFLSHPFGVGTGNVDDYLGEQLRSLGQKELAEENYNPHNQFLQIAIELGIFGLLYFLGLLIYLLRYAWRNKDYLLFIVTSGLLFNSFFESMLQRQSGIVFYVFFVCFLLSLTKNEIAQDIKTEL